MASSEDRGNYRGGAIWIHRKILDWEWYTDSTTMRVFIHCLLRANWKDGRFFGEPVPRGSFITSYRSLARELNLSERSIRTALNHLKATQEVTQYSTSKHTMITIVNYDEYQRGDTQNDTQLTHDRHSLDTQVTTNEESNKGNKGKKENIKPPHKGWIPADSHSARYVLDHPSSEGWRIEVVNGKEWGYRVKQ